MSGFIVAFGMLGGLALFCGLVWIFVLAMSFNDVKKYKWATSISLMIIGAVLIAASVGIGSNKDCTDYTAAEYTEGEVPIKCQHTYVVPVEAK